MGPANTLFTVEVSNAKTSMALFEGDTLLDQWAIATRIPATIDEIDMQLRTFLQVRGHAIPESSILCSVVPPLTTVWGSALRSLTEARVFVVGPGLKSGIAMGYKDPGQVGTDRVANAVAARDLYGAPVIVADCDDVTSLSIVAEDGSFLGGAIAAGIGMSLSSLSIGAAQLSDIDIRMPASAIGRTTQDAILAGVVFGEATRVDGLTKAAWRELGYESALVLTGSYADLVQAASTLDFNVRTDLTLWGLHSIYKRNAR